MIMLILRDDDLSYFTDPEYLEYLYQDIWDRHPILFSVIPEVSVYQQEVPLNGTYTKKYYSISDNEKLVSFLRRKILEGKIQIAQHGFTHENMGKKFELEVGTREKLHTLLVKGRILLRKTFGVSVEILVPPHDRITREGVIAAEQAGFTIINRGFAPLPREIQWGNLKYLVSYLKLSLFYLKQGRHFRYPQKLNFGNHDEIFSYRIEDLNQKNIQKIVDHSRGGVLSVTFHYRATSLLHRELLDLLIRKVQKHNREHP